MAKHLLAMLAVFGLSMGCTSIKYLLLDPLPPKVEFLDFQVRKAGFTEVKADAVLAIENPNEFDITLKALDYKVWYQDKALASGKLVKPIQMPAGQSSKAKVPVTIKTSMVIEFVSKFLNKASGASLRLQGTGVFDSPAGVLEVPFDKTHRLKP